MIVASAIKYKGVFYTGVRHPEIFKDLKRLGNKPPFTKTNGYEQGFIDNHGCFFDREYAKKIVIDCGQKYDPISNTLTSEDLW